MAVTIKDLDSVNPGKHVPAIGKNIVEDNYDLKSDLEKNLINMKSYPTELKSLDSPESTGYQPYPCGTSGSAGTGSGGSHMKDQFEMEEKFTEGKDDGMKIGSISHNNNTNNPQTPTITPPPSKISAL